MTESMSPSPLLEQPVGSIDRVARTTPPEVEKCSTGISRSLVATSKLTRNAEHLEGYDEAHAMTAKAQPRHAMQACALDAKNCFLLHILVYSVSYEFPLS